MWDPKQYHQFSDARMRPGYDLLAQIPDNHYESIIDLGCGTGELTKQLQEKFQPKQIIGLDSSETMLAKAKSQFDTITWQLNNIENVKENYDLIFSNAALQWIDNHEALMKKLLNITKKTIAIQVPNNFDMPSHVLLRETIEEEPYFYKKLAHTLRYQPVLTPKAYYDIFSEKAKAINIWTTTYWQALTGEHAVLAWVKGTALTPIEAALDADDFQRFVEIYQAKLDKAYPRREDGTTLFDFSRLFIMAVLS